MKKNIGKILKKHSITYFLKGLLSHINKEQFPGQALACALYIEGGIRTSEIGSFMFGKYDKTTKKETYADNELVRLAIPRRTYTQSHIDYVVEKIISVYKNRKKIKGVRITKQPELLRHFTASLTKIN